MAEKIYLSPGTVVYTKDPVSLIVNQAGQTTALRVPLNTKLVYRDPAGHDWPLQKDEQKRIYYSKPNLKCKRLQVANETVYVDYPDGTGPRTMLITGNPSQPAPPYPMHVTRIIDGVPVQYEVQRSSKGIFFVEVEDLAPPAMPAGQPKPRLADPKTFQEEKPEAAAPPVGPVGELGLFNEAAFRKLFGGDSGEGALV